MKLYDYWRSSAGYRVRIALNLKGLMAERMAIDIRSGVHRNQAFREINPAEAVPLLVTDEGARIGQSLAIMEWLEERYPSPPLLPIEPLARARVRAVALQVACDIHPVNNLRITQYLERELGQAEDARTTWYHHWIAEGLSALEAMLAPGRGPYAFGERPTMADLCLVPQLYNARRFGCPLEAYPRLVAIDSACQALAAFADARPEAQSDAA